MKGTHPFTNMKGCFPFRLQKGDSPQKSGGPKAAAGT
jgi:hypothetical protein